MNPIKKQRKQKETDKHILRRKSSSRRSQNKNKTTQNKQARLKPTNSKQMKQIYVKIIMMHHNTHTHAQHAHAHATRTHNTHMHTQHAHAHTHARTRTQERTNERTNERSKQKPASRNNRQERFSYVRVCVIRKGGHIHLIFNSNSNPCMDYSTANTACVRPARTSANCELCLA